MFSSLICFYLFFLYISFGTFFGQGIAPASQRGVKQRNQNMESDILRQHSLALSPWPSKAFKLRIGESRTREWWTVFILRPTNVRIWHKAVFKVGPVAGPKPNTRREWWTPRKTSQQEILKRKKQQKHPKLETDDFPRGTKKKNVNTETNIEMKWTTTFWYKNTALNNTQPNGHSEFLRERKNSEILRNFQFPANLTSRRKQDDRTWNLSANWISWIRTAWLNGIAWNRNVFQN